MGGGGVEAPGGTERPVPRAAAESSSAPPPLPRPARLFLLVASAMAAQRLGYDGTKRSAHRNRLEPAARLRPAKGGSFSRKA